VHAGLGTLADIFAGLRRRWGNQGLSIHLDSDTGAALSWGQQDLRLSWTLLGPTVGGLMLAVLWRDPILSLWSLILGGIGTLGAYRSQPKRTAEDRAQQELFLSALRSRYGITQSLRRTLEGVLEDLDLSESTLHQTLTEVIRLLNAGEPVKKAVQPFATQGDTLRRLATILRHAHEATPEELRQLLNELVEQAVKARRLAERAQVTLTVTRTTLQALILANVTAMTLVTSLPLWRSYYLSRPSTYVAATGLGLAGVLYFRFKIKELEESL
jgi:hypothetical protein